MTIILEVLKKMTRGDGLGEPFVTFGCWEAAGWKAYFPY